MYALEHQQSDAYSHQAAVHYQIEVRLLEIGCMGASALVVLAVVVELEVVVADLDLDTLL